MFSRRSSSWLQTGVVLSLLIATRLPAQALTTNSWTDGSDKWETPGNWSLNLAPSTNGQSAILITNAGNNTVTIDATTVGVPSTMTISNLLVSAPSNSTNTLFLNNAGSITPLRVRRGVKIGSGGSVVITNSVLRVDGLSGGEYEVDGTVMLRANALLVTTNAEAWLGRPGLGSMRIDGGTYLGRQIHLGHDAAGAAGAITIAGGICSLREYLAVAGGPGTTGDVWLVDGQLIVPNDGTEVGDLGVGQMTVSNGTFTAHHVDVGFMPGSCGTLTIAGGTSSVSQWLAIGNEPASTGTVWITGGMLIVTNENIAVGDRGGLGQMTISNGTVIGRDQHVGNFAGSRGTFTMAGGTNLLSSILTVGREAGTTGTVWMTGGLLVVTNDSTFIGSDGVGAVTVSNGTWLARDVHVAAGVGSQGSLTFHGGVTTISSSLLVGNCSLGVTGIVHVAGGMLEVTNESQTAVLEVSGGTFTLSGGAVVVDVFVMTNACAQFVRTGGTLTVFDVVLNDGDDTDGDGYSNLDEENAVTDPLDPGSFPIVTENSWINPVGDSWSVLANWSAGVAPGNTQSIFITNVNTKIVSIDAGAPGDTLTISNLTISAATGETNALAVADLSQPFEVLAQVNINTGGRLELTNATMRVNGVVAVDGAVLLLDDSSLISTNQALAVGNTGIGEMTISNGTVLSGVFQLGAVAGSVGTLTLAGGTTTVDSVLLIGAIPCASTGSLAVAGGNLFVTNATGNAVLEVRSGKLLLDSGTLTIDTLVMTNDCGQFVHTGGTLVYGNAVLTSSRDDDADGIPNGFEQDNGLDPLNPVNSTLDSDGDSLTDLQEYLAGTDPTNSVSSFRIIGVATEGDDVNITWMTGPDKTNALERSTGATDGSYSNNFTEIFTATDTTGTVTNYLDLGAATNAPAYYYRVRLVP